MSNKIRIEMVILYMVLLACSGGIGGSIIYTENYRQQWVDEWQAKDAAKSKVAAAVERAESTLRLFEGDFERRLIVCQTNGDGSDEARDKCKADTIEHLMRLYEEEINKD